jgi:hypothetical protein
VWFAVTEKQALLLSLAKSRGCSAELVLRNPNKPPTDDEGYDFDKVSKFLSEVPEPIEVAPAPHPVGERP